MSGAPTSRDWSGWMLDVATGQQDHQQEDIDGTLLLEARMLLVAMPGAPSSVPAPSSKARSP